MTKICSKCKREKPVSEFFKRSDGDGYRYQCKNCSSRKNTDVVEKAGAKKKLSEEERKLRRKASSKKCYNKPESKAKNAARQAKRRAAKLNATPKWLSEGQLKHMETYYLVARELSIWFGCSLEVDHEIPLLGKTVCGLHVPWNLCITTEEDNIKKGNRL